MVIFKEVYQCKNCFGRAGVSVPAKEMLQFKMAHARDAVFSLLNIDELMKQLHAFSLPVYLLKVKLQIGTFI